MIINSVTEYLPCAIISNEYFFEVAGLSCDEIISKSGIKQRRRTQPQENANSMAIEVVKKAHQNLPFSLDEIDLIIGATYTPYDTVGTIAHAVQKEFSIENTRCFTVGSACSSFVNAMEVAESFFANKKANKALIITSENNSAYVDDADRNTGFLFGDGAAAVFVTNERYSLDDIEVLDMNTTGLGHIGESTEAIFVRPNDGGLKMPFGKDVFYHACQFMIRETEQILKKNNIPISKLHYFIPHQANARITDYVASKLHLEPSRVLTNIEHCGNTGSASAPIVLAQNFVRFQPNDLIVISVFGGGYSSGALLLRKF